MFRALDYLVRGGVTACLFAFVIVAQAVAGDAQPVNADPDKVAINGYDTVAYFTEARPTRGVAEFAQTWQGAKWWFAKAEHRDRFAADPERYAPRFGGFCAMGMSLGLQLKADPEAWAIVDDKLYLNSDQPALAEFKADTTGHLAKAETFWEKTVLGNN